MAGSCERVRVDASRVRDLQGLIDADRDAPSAGADLPPLWHWAALPQWFDPARTGRDGHPERPREIAERAGVRRMFAGGEVTFHGRSPSVGEDLSVSTSLTAVDRKSGRSGEFLLATFASEITDARGTLLISERQDVVYVDPRPGEVSREEGVLPVVGRPLSRRSVGEYELVTDPSTLLRFSALTSNSHRIHYDLPYAQEVENLPGLLVHGPLVTLGLLHAARSVDPEAVVRRVVHRNLAPLYCGQTAFLRARASPRGLVAEALSTVDSTTPYARLEVELDEPSTGAATHHDHEREVR